MTAEKANLAKKNYFFDKKKDNRVEGVGSS
jgi:hypothetical protein